MTGIASICERWAMPLEPPTKGDRWFLDWALESPQGVSGHLSSSWHAYLSLLDLYQPEEINSAREYFGGIGAHALMIQELFAPADHVVMDFSRHSVEHLQQVLPALHVRQGDAYDPRSTFSADLVGLDFGDLTVWKIREGNDRRRLLDRVFKLKPKAVVLTDIAGPRLHLQRERYETLLGPGTCASYPCYLIALATLLEEIYGYRLHAGFYHRWSTVMALVPEAKTERGQFQPTPEDPIGLEIL